MVVTVLTDCECNGRAAGQHQLPAPRPSPARPGLVSPTVGWWAGVVVPLYSVRLYCATACRDSGQNTAATNHQPTPPLPGTPSTAGSPSWWSSSSCGGCKTLSSYRSAVSSGLNTALATSVVFSVTVESGGVVAQ